MTTPVSVNRRARLEVDGNGHPLQNYLHPEQTINFTYSTVAGLNTNNPIASAQVVRIRSTTDCFVRFSPSGTLATTSDMFLPANTPETFSLRGDSYISAIQSASGGTLYITLMD